MTFRFMMGITYCLYRSHVGDGRAERPGERCGGEPIVHTVVLHLVDPELQVHTGFPTARLQRRVGNGRAEASVTDAAESIDAHGGRHGT